ncbi:Putative glucose-6-phosphate 1-epimerase [Serratia marcescens]|nr:Putative glucose-6-phosphate 1-epimerase [Serratia marcescens]
MNEKIFTLPVSEQISPYISQRQLDELGVVVVSHPKVRAAVALQGAHLLAWQPSGEQPVIWLSNNTPFAKGKAIRGGVPICWPWFGPVAQPSHGFARNQPWSLTAHDEDDNGVILTFTLKDNEQTRKLFLWHACWRCCFRGCSSTVLTFIKPATSTIPLPGRLAAHRDRCAKTGA